MSSLEQQLNSATGRLVAAGIASARADAEWLCADLLDVSRGELAVLIAKGQDWDESLSEAFEERLRRRESREPLQHILGSAPFLDFSVSVGPGVFVPRPETEVLAERVLSHAAHLGVPDSGLHLVDMCSGSGILAIAMARAVPYASVSAIEQSGDAVTYLQKNVADLAPEVQVYHQDVVSWGALVPEGSIDLLVANPPYIPSSEVPNDPEVAHFDPPVALYSGEDGLDLIREIALIARRLLRPGAMIALEHSNLQGHAVRDTLSEAGFRTIETYRDLTDRDRFTTGFQP